MSLATRLFLLTLLTALPIFVILFALERVQIADRRTEVIASARSAAALAVVRQNRNPNSAAAVLSLVARIPAVRNREAEQCAAELARFVATLHGVLGLAAYSPNGQAVCASDDAVTSLQPHLQPYFGEAAKSGQTLMSAYANDPRNGAGVVTFVHPVLAENGAAQTLLVLPVTVQTLSASLNDPPLPAGAFAATVDDAGTITMRWPNPEAWTGKRLQDMPWAAALAAGAQTFTEGGVEYALASGRTTEAAGLAVVVALPITPTLQMVQRQFEQSIGLIIAAFLAAALAALLLARVWVGRPMQALQAAADAVAKGDLKARPPHASIPEVQALSRRFGQMAEALELRLHEKDVLLREVNHRVKNSLQLVSSMLMLHRSQLRDASAKEQFDSVASKVATIGRVHQRLYQGEDLDAIAFGTFLTEMVKDLDEMMGAPTVTCHAEAVRLTTDRAIPLALIVNELVTNAAKHSDPSGCVRVTLIRDGGMAVLSVEDEAPLPSDFTLERAPGLGLRVITSLVRQLGGTLSVEPRGAGKAFVVKVPVG